MLFTPPNLQRSDSGNSEFAWIYHRGRLCIFLLFDLSLGLLLLVWALAVLRRHCRRKGGVSFFVVLVLLNDGLELSLNAFVFVRLIAGDCYWDTHTACWTLSSLWSGSVVCGVHLQLMMVFEGVLALRRPPRSAHVLVVSCSTVISVIELIYYFLCKFLLLSLLPLLAVMVTSWILACRSPPFKDPRSNRARKQDCAALGFTTFTMIIYLSLIALHLCQPNWYLWTTSVCLSLKAVKDRLH
ncbi:hypothetical protein NFI96_008593 [Prochilodus magdalenae]|nr:hypothetical protein NFI96_008593 [Prochilodus magdalenae]